MVVVVDELALVDLDVEDPADPRLAEDTFGCGCDLGVVFDAAGPDPVLEGEELGLDVGDEFDAAVVVTPEPFPGRDDDTAPPVYGDLAGC